MGFGSLSRPGIILGLFLAGLAVLGAEPKAWVSAPSGRSRPLAVRPAGKAGFSPVPSSESGLLFTNRLPVERSLTNHILMNGSGVALGDVDGDGRCDVFFAGLEGGSALFRNLGNWRFTNITASALKTASGDPGSLGSLDASGALLADLDGDGLPELLVNSVGRGTHCWHNEGRGVFRDVTASSGLGSDSGGSSFAAADVDGDGDLDLYVVRYRSTTVRDAFQQQFRIQQIQGRPMVTSVNGRPTTDPDLVGRFTVDESGQITEHGEADQLFRNEGGCRFTPVSFTDGSFLDERGVPLTSPPYDWGLAAMFRDINRDGAPDLYVCNDLGSPDRIWINDGRGRFRAIARTAIRKTSWFSMGVDFGDLNRDGHDDFLVTDMLSRDWARRQADLALMRSDAEPFAGVEARPQTPRNTVFAGVGDGTFTEVGWWAGLAASDWSWSPVLVDVDLDGFEDVLITTGFQRDVQDADVAEEIERIRQRERLSDAAAIRLRTRFPSLSQPNLAFRNRGDLGFAESGADWGFDAVGISQGMALADLDGDGDLDCAINDQNGPARLLRNDTPAPRLLVRLHGDAGNRAGVGARIRVTGGPVSQEQEVISGGRYLSADEPARVFAAGGADRRLTVRVRWRSGRETVWEDVPANSELEVAETAAIAGPTATPPPDPWFADVSGLLNHRHVDAAFDESVRQPLLPRSLSRLGPAVAWGDLNRDGADDLVIGSGRGGRLGVYLNDGRGGFVPSSAGVLERPTPMDHAGILVRPRDGEPPELLLGLSRYEGDGAGGLRMLDLETGAIRLGGSLNAAIGPMAMADVDGDGVLDLFLGGRVQPGRFPEPASSALLLGAGSGWKVDAQAGERLQRLGLVTAAVFSDLDGDGDPDLAVACDWGPIRLLWNDGGKWSEKEMGLRWSQGRDGPVHLHELTGGWQGITAVDLDEDGRLDLVAANWGLNTRHRESPIPGVGIRAYFGDFDTNGTVEFVETRWDPAARHEAVYLSRSRLAAAWPAIGERYPTRRGLASASIADVLAAAAPPVQTLQAAVLESIVLLNRGDHFEVHPLPPQAQWAPASAVASADFDGDGHEDLFLAQNLCEEGLGEERMDSGSGLWLRGDGKGGMEAVSPLRSGIRIPGEQRSAAVADYDQDGRPDLVVTQNGESTRLYRNLLGVPGLRIRLEGPAGNPVGVGVRLRWISGGRPTGPVRELRAGSGCRSQDSPVMVWSRPTGSGTLQVRWPGKESVQVDVSADAMEVALTPSGLRVLR